MLVPVRSAALDGAPVPPLVEEDAAILGTIPDVVVVVFVNVVPVDSVELGGVLLPPCFLDALRLEEDLEDLDEDLDLSESVTWRPKLESETDISEKNVNLCRCQGTSSLI